MGIIKILNTCMKGIYTIQLQLKLDSFFSIITLLALPR